MKNKAVIVVSVVIIIFVMLALLVFMKADTVNNVFTEDEISFKNEYESLNGKELAPGYLLKDVNIDKDNNIKYVSDDEILGLLSEGKNIIYFGWADCNWCRTVVPILISSLKERDVKTIYYYDLKNLRNSYENDTDSNSVKLYESILDVIGENIESVFDEESNRSGKKKILAPTVVFVDNGDVVGVHVKSVDSQEKSTDELNSTQAKELKDIYQMYLNKLSSNVCSTEGC